MPVSFLVRGRSVVRLSVCHNFRNGREFTFPCSSFENLYYSLAYGHQLYILIHLFNLIAKSLIINDESIVYIGLQTRS